MCVGANEPGGPRRCSYHAGESLASARARYASEVMSVRSIEQDIETLDQSLHEMNDIIDRSDYDTDLVDRSEQLYSSRKKAQEDLHRHAKKRDKWRQKLKESQVEYDSTRGGLEDINQQITHIDQELQNPELTAEQADFYNRSRNRLIERFNRGRNNLAEQHGSQYQRIDTSDDSEDKPNNGPSDELNDPEFNQELDQMIDDLDISAVYSDKQDFVDPDTGEKVTEKEMRAISKSRRSEARARIRRQREADGDNKEMLRSFLRMAVYRGLRYNKSTRKITRLIGVGQFNSLVDKMEEIKQDTQDNRAKKKKDKWRKNRIGHLDAEVRSLHDQHNKDQESHDRKIERLDKELDEGKINQAEYDRRVRDEKADFEEKDAYFRNSRIELEDLRSVWAEEHLEEERRKERQEEELHQAAIKKRRQREQLEEALQDADY